MEGVQRFKRQWKVGSINGATVTSISTSALRDRMIRLVQHMKRQLEG